MGCPGGATTVGYCCSGYIAPEVAAGGFAFVFSPLVTTVVLHTDGGSELTIRV